MNKNSRRTNVAQVETATNMLVNREDAPQHFQAVSNDQPEALTLQADDHPGSTVGSGRTGNTKCSVDLFELDKVQKRARSYLAKVPPAYRLNTHTQPFKAARILTLGFDLTPEKAYAIFAEWNSKCQPPWSEKDIWLLLNFTHKENSSRGDLLRGRPYFRDDDTDGFEERQGRAPWAVRGR